MEPVRQGEGGAETCPFCAEPLGRGAIRCRSCGKTLAVEPGGAPAATGDVQPDAQRQRRRVGIVLVLLGFTLALAGGEFYRFHADHAQLVAAIADYTMQRVTGRIFVARDVEKEFQRKRAVGVGLAIAGMVLALTGAAVCVSHAAAWRERTRLST